MKKRAPILLHLYTGRIKGTPLGDLRLAVSNNGLAAVSWIKDEALFHDYLFKRYRLQAEPDTGKITLAANEIRKYLQGSLKKFTFKIDWFLLRPFQQAVLRATYAIPYGETRGYGEIANQIYRPNSARAVGRAEATNPMPLVIPCHRVIGKKGKLCGYSGGKGISTKEWLLKMEGAVLT
jgi:methylated-DNA-[protein]-cysteine S-methyltransferase